MKTTKTVLLFFLSMILTASGEAQEISLTTGLTLNHFYHHKKEKPRFGIRYGQDVGLHLGINCKLNPKESEKGFSGIFYLSYDSFRGRVSIGSGGIGSSSFTRLEFQNHILGLAFFPADWKIFKNKVFLNLGPEVSYLLSSQSAGSYTQADSGGSLEYQDLSQMARSVHANVKIGLTARIKYEIQLTERLRLVPQYAFRFGVGREFREYASIVRAMMHRLVIGVKL